MRELPSPRSPTIRLDDRRVRYSLDRDHARSLWSVAKQLVYEQFDYPPGRPAAPAAAQHANVRNMAPSNTSSRSPNWTPLPCGGRVLLLVLNR